MSAFLERLAQAYDLAPHALVGGAAVALAAGVVGALLRWRRVAWAGLAVPSAGTAGVAFALGGHATWHALGLPGHGPVEDVGLWAAWFTAAAVLLVVPVGRARGRDGERAAALCFVVSTTLAVLLVAESPHGDHEVASLATGRALLFLSHEDMLLLRAAMPALALVGVLLARRVAHLSFDRDHARAAGRAVVSTELAFAGLFAALVALGVPRVGAPFLFAALTVPSAAAERVAARPTTTAAVAGGVAALGFTVGATASVAWDWPFSTGVVAGLLATGAAVALLGRGARALAGRG